MNETVTGSLDSKSLEKATLLKISWRIIPFICVLYIFNILDRSNLGFARQAMEVDIGLTKAAFDIAYGLFYIGYLIFEIPSNLLLTKIGARIWISRIMITWGLVSILTMFVQDVFQLNAVRILLGVAEAGFFPGIILYLTFWFPARERAKVVALFMVAIAFAGVLGNPLSGLILQYLNKVAGLSGWQWLFLLEGLPSVLLGLFVLKFLPNGPTDAPWLDAKEKAWLKNTLEEEANVRLKNRGTNHVWAMLDPRVLLLTCLYFTVAVGANASGAYLPTLIAQHFPKSLPFQVGLISALPHVCSVILMILLSRWSDKVGRRSPFVALASGLAALGWLIAWRAGDPWMALGGLCLAQAGMMSMLPVFWPLPSTFLGGAAAAGGIAFINSVANIGGFYGPTVLGKFGLEAVALTMGIGTVLALIAGVFVEPKKSIQERT
ncbi:MAG: MFS transporter [Gemmataceae bacterium]|nr:MFS transporter [Gemmataceae bacterium]